MARLVVPGVPHHVTQRGNGRATTFFDDGDDALYRDLLAEHCAAAGKDEAMSARLRRAESIGRPIGDAAFITEFERRTRRPLAPAGRGPKPKDRI
jgi:putative transposase